jgi:hypothetical protein
MSRTRSAGNVIVTRSRIDTERLRVTIRMMIVDHAQCPGSLAPLGPHRNCRAYSLNRRVVRVELTPVSSNSTLARRTASVGRQGG